MATKAEPVSVLSRKPKHREAARIWVSLTGATFCFNDRLYLHEEQFLFDGETAYCRECGDFLAGIGDPEDEPAYVRKHANAR